MQTIGNILVPVTGGWQTSRTCVVRGYDGRRTDGWDVSQQFLRRKKDRQLGLEPNSFSNGRRMDAGYSGRLGLKLNSFSVGRRTDACDLSQIGLKPNSFAVGRRTDIWDSSWLGLESIDSFGHILCKEVPCLTVLGTRDLTQACEFVRGLRYKLQMMGILVDYPTFMFGDNKSVLANTTNPGSTIKKKSQLKCFHFICSGCARDERRTDYVKT